MQNELKKKEEELAAQTKNSTATASEQTAIRQLESQYKQVRVLCVEQRLGRINLHFTEIEQVGSNFVGQGVGD